MWGGCVERSCERSGRRTVVDVDLEKFLDRVNHDIPIDRQCTGIEDAEIIRLIRAYLNDGTMSDGMVLDRYQGTLQGGPMNPLLANLMLDEVDNVLEEHLNFSTHPCGPACRVLWEGVGRASGSSLSRWS